MPNNFYIRSKNLLCQHCGKLFESNKGLSTHGSVQTGEYCRNCEHGSNDGKSMQVHERLHPPEAHMGGMGIKSRSRLHSQHQQQAFNHNNNTMPVAKNTTNCPRLAITTLANQVNSLDRKQPNLCRRSPPKDPRQKRTYSSASAYVQSQMSPPRQESSLNSSNINSRHNINLASTQPTAVPLTIPLRNVKIEMPPEEQQPATGESRPCLIKNLTGMPQDNADDADGNNGVPPSGNITNAKLASLLEKWQQEMAELQGKNNTLLKKLEEVEKKAKLENNETNAKLASLAEKCQQKMAELKEENETIRKKQEKAEEKFKREAEEGYSVEQVLDWSKDKNGKLEYFVKFYGYSSKWNSWESREKLAHLDVIKEYEAANYLGPFAIPSKSAESNKPSPGRGHPRMSSKRMHKNENGDNQQDKAFSSSSTAKKSHLN